MNENTPPAGDRDFKDLIAGMVGRFDAQTAGDLSATIQYHGSGSGGGDCYLSIADRKCEFHNGLADGPTMTINTPTSVWLAISSGELSGQQAFMTGQYKVDGDVSLLMRMGNLFPSP